MMGTEWIVEAYGCSPVRLRDLSTLELLFARIVEDLDLHPCADAQWHRFETHGGITGLTMLSESHLACHSFPEHGTLCLNVFCCRARPEWPFAERLRDILGAEAVNVRRVERPYLDARLKLPTDDIARLKPRATDEISRPQPRATEEAV